MVSAESQSVIRRAKDIYQTQLAHLEQSHAGQFVAIEPESASYYIADTFDAAVRLARDVQPDRIVHVIRIGDTAALRIGVLQQ